MCRLIPHFYGFLTEKSFYGMIMFVIQGDLQDQKVNFNFQFLKILFLTSSNINKHHDLFLCFNDTFKIKKKNSKVKM